MERSYHSNHENLINRISKVKMAENEVVVKQYRVGTLNKSRRKGEATVLVTNQRVIYKSYTDQALKNSNELQEVAIETITGVKNFYAKGRVLWKIVLAVIFALYALSSLISSFPKTYNMYGYPYGSSGFQITPFLLACLFGFFAYILFKSSEKPSYIFTLFATASGESISTSMNSQSLIANLRGHNTSIAFEFVPTEEVIEMMCELGACVLDLKTHGARAVEKWKNSSTPEPTINDKPLEPHRAEPLRYRSSPAKEPFGGSSTPKKPTPPEAPHPRIHNPSPNPSAYDEKKSNPYMGKPPEF